MKALFEAVIFRYLAVGVGVGCALTASATPEYTFTTIAGVAPLAGNTNGAGSAARFQNPDGLALDNLGNLYVADSSNHLIRKITSDGEVTTFAGSGSPGSDDGTGTAASFNFPAGLTVDSAGNLYVADSENHTIRKITSAGVVTTLAGLAGQVGSADNTGSLARFNNPLGVAVDGAGNILVADTSNQTIRSIAPDGAVSTIAGLTGTAGKADGTGTSARFTNPFGVAVDSYGNVFVADNGNHAIRRIAGTVVTTFAGSAGNSGSVDGIGTAAKFNAPYSLTIDAAGNIYVADFNNDEIRLVTQAGVVTTVGGAHVSGSTNGTGSNARFSNPAALALDVSGNLYVADYSNNAIRFGQPSNNADFNTDARTDIIWQNTATGARYLWLMNGTAFVGGGDLGIVSTDWHIAGTGDFNGDSHTDILWENTITGDRGIWLVNGVTVTGWVDLGNVSTDWQIAGTGDFNNDGKTDILWENIVSGQRYIWFMNGIAVVAGGDLGIVPLDWRIAGTGDFNGDGQTDILWEDTVTGDRGLWLMHGATVIGWADLGVISTDWRIAGTGDFNGDGWTDILWENTSSGERGIWLMNGLTVIGWAELGVLPTTWDMAK